MKREKRWSVASARREFAELLRAAEREPQPIYRHGRVAAVVAPVSRFPELAGLGSRPKWASMSEALAELRDICRRERYTIRIPKRRDRPNAFVKVLDELDR